MRSTICEGLFRFFVIDIIVQHNIKNVKYRHYEVTWLCFYEKVKNFIIKRPKMFVIFAAKQFNSNFLGNIIENLKNILLDFRISLFKGSEVKNFYVFYFFYLKYFNESFFIIYNYKYFSLSQTWNLRVELFYT